MLQLFENEGIGDKQNISFWVRPYSLSEIPKHFQKLPKPLKSDGRSILHVTDRR